MGLYIDVHVNSYYVGTDKAEVFKKHYLREFHILKKPHEKFLVLKIVLGLENMR